MSAYPLLAELLEYPGPGLTTLAERCRAAVAPSCEAAASSIEAFGLFAASADERELEELYARSFDFSPAHSLDLGYQLFGESYKRGIFLVKVQASVRAHRVDSGTELADHLPVVLRLLEKLERGEAYSLADEAVLPALAKILGAFQDPTNPYRMLLEAAKALLCADFAITHIRPAPEDRPMVVPGMEPQGPPMAANRHDEAGGTAR
ncbi:MAG: nitrate reductase molybdenum cofactor assembly chaperone [Myxococcaceae bacterium]